METAFRSFMRAQADLTYLLGTGADDTHPFRWYALVIPQNAAYPAVRFRAESPPLEETFSQSGVYELVTTRIDLEIWAVTYAESLSVWSVIRRAVRPFHRERANTPQGPLGGIPVQSMTVTTGPSDSFYTPEDGGKQGFHVREASIEIIHKEED